MNYLIANNCWSALITITASLCLRMWPNVNAPSCQINHDQRVGDTNETRERWFTAGKMGTRMWKPRCFVWPGGGDRGIRWPGEGGGHGHAPARKLGDTHTDTQTDRGRNTGIVGESERRWIMDIPMAGDISALVTAGQEMGSHGKQRGNMIGLRRVSDCLFLEIIITLLFYLSTLSSQLFARRQGDKWENILTDWNILHFDLFWGHKQQVSNCFCVLTGKFTHSLPLFIF